MIAKFFSLAVLFLSLIATPLWAQKSAEKNLPLDGSIAPNGLAVELRWYEANPPRVGAVIINRRQLGQSGGTTWQALGPALRPVVSFVDNSTEPGIAYEYQVMRTARDIVDVGYWTTGVALPVEETRGTAYLIVDKTISKALATHLARLTQDLIGDGWRVLRHDTPRGTLDKIPENLAAAQVIKTWLRGQYAKDPSAQHTVLLIGHVPIPMSGRVAPDGHSGVPHATDLFYAEMNGVWRISSGGIMRENQLPSDAIEMQIGRIDFSNVSGGEEAEEVALLRAYFDKNHHWRRGLLGDLRGAYGGSNHLLVEQLALRNVVGPQAVERGGHHDVGESKPWLLGVDFGASGGLSYQKKYANKAVFAINFGSHKQKIELRFNEMTALLAQPWYPIAVGWGGRPAWRLHHMALGGSVGEMHRRTVNNGVASRPYRETMDYYPTGQYLWRNPIWINLLGDPTARAFPLAPPGPVSVSRVTEGVEISWEASVDPDTTGYRIYRANPDTGHFEPIEKNRETAITSFVDTTGTAGARYMVRAEGFKDVYAGSFHTLSQGVFSPLGPVNTEPVKNFFLTTSKDQRVELPEVFNHPQKGQIHAIIHAPTQGNLTREARHWYYTPPGGFTGVVTVPISISDRWHTRSGKLKITVTQ